MEFNPGGTEVDENDSFKIADDLHITAVLFRHAFASLCSGANGQPELAAG